MISTEEGQIIRQAVQTQERNAQRVLQRELERRRGGSINQPTVNKTRDAERDSGIIPRNPRLDRCKDVFLREVAERASNAELMG